MYKQAMGIAMSGMNTAYTHRDSFLRAVSANMTWMVGPYD